MNLAYRWRAWVVRKLLTTYDLQYPNNVPLESDQNFASICRQLAKYSLLQRQPNRMSHWKHLMTEFVFNGKFACSY